VRKRFNINEFIWFVILLGFSYYFYKLISTGEIVNFMHPKMVRYVYVGFAALGILTIYQFFNLMDHHEEGSVRYGYVMFIIPLLLGFFLNPKGLDAYAVQNRGISVFQKGNTASVANSIKSQEEIKVVDGEIAIDNKNYLQVMNKLYDDVNKYKGKKITIKGFVYRDKEFVEDNFVAARMKLSCCAADAEVIGFMCKFSGSNKLNKDQWVQVTGTIEVGSLNAKNGQRIIIPLIKVEKLMNIEEPVNKYIYQ
jgi:putative membrane protein